MGMTINIKGLWKKVHLCCIGVIFDISNNKGVSKRLISVALHGCVFNIKNFQQVELSI